MLRYLKHTLHVIALIATIAIVEYDSFCQKEECLKSRNWQYGQTLSVILTAVHLLIILPLPQTLFNILGLILYDAFPGEVLIKEQFLKDDMVELSEPGKNYNLPHICYRVVTRGLYPELVMQNVHRNFLTCIETGLVNFSIEVVTDVEIYLNNSDQRIKQLVVPSTYRSSTGAMFKARALQYALEPGISSVNDEDYIVHLDEETIITKNVINGIVNFALEGKHSFGQGLITYMNLEVVNLLTTLADSFRVADDMGKVRFQLSALHRPIFGWKGSFVVTRCGAERDVSFDHGPDGSIAEDCYFSMVAYNKGYTFDFIQGEMFEKSPFTVLDLIRQRKRWIQGIWLVVHSGKIPIRTKFFLAMSHYAWLTLPITSLSYVLSMIFPLPTPVWLTPIGSFCSAVTLYMYIFGLLKSLDLRSRPLSISFIYLVGQVFTLSLNMVIENIAVIWSLITPKHNFYIVQKDLSHKVIPDV